MDKQNLEKLCALTATKQVVIVCIGTDIVGGDCLGPLVGQLLTEAGAPVFVYGTLNNPITALNINSTGEFVKTRHRNKLILAVDSAVGSEVGRIEVSRGALCPGLADGKSLTPIGDVSITATTTSSLPGEKEFSLVRLGLVWRLAREICDLILESLRHSLYYARTFPATEIAAAAH